MITLEEQRLMMAKRLGVRLGRVRFWDELTEAQKQWELQAHHGLAPANLPQYVYAVNWRGQVVGARIRL
jgi:hypothetical protein